MLAVAGDYCMVRYIGYSQLEAWQDEHAEEKLALVEDMLGLPLEKAKEESSLRSDLLEEFAEHLPRLMVAVVDHW